MNLLSRPSGSRGVRESNLDLMQSLFRTEQPGYGLCTMAQSVCHSRDGYSSEDWWAGNSKRKVWTRLVNTVIPCFFFFSVRRLWKNIHFSGREGLRSASRDLLHNSLGSWIVLEEEDEEARKAPDNQGRSNNWKLNIKKYWARMDGQKLKGTKSQSLKKEVPLSWPQRYAERPEVRFEDCPWQCSFCASLDRQWSSWGKWSSLLLLRSGGVKSSSLPATWRLGCLIWGAGRGWGEAAGALVHCSSTLPPTAHFIPLGNAAVTMMSI